jgi:nicotinamide-nucleotide amidase
VRERLRVDIGLGVTGVAGPGGGTPEKPVGTVHVEAAFPDVRGGAHFSLPGERRVVRARAAASALHLIRQILATKR